MFFSLSHFASHKIKEFSLFITNFFVYKPIIPTFSMIADNIR